MSTAGFLPGRSEIRARRRCAPRCGRRTRTTFISWLTRRADIFLARPWRNTASNTEARPDDRRLENEEGADPGDRPGDQGRAMDTGGDRPAAAAAPGGAWRGRQNGNGIHRGRAERRRTEGNH